MQPGWLAAGLLALLRGISAQGAPAPGTSLDSATLVDRIAADRDERVATALARMDGVDRRLLALRSYLRAGDNLSRNWSWTADQIHAYRQSQEYAALQAEIEQVQRAFTAANPGFDLWVNPDVRSLDTQIANWNSNESVALAAANLRVAFGEWLSSSAVRRLPAGERKKFAARFLMKHVPTPAPALAAPGLSPHGQMRAIDFQIRKRERLVAAPRSATIRSNWDEPGWTQKLQAAVRAGSEHFAGPLTSPREPWHYTYLPAD